jgi:hypothetical protein
MNNLTRNSVILLATFFLPALLSVHVESSQDVAEPAQLPVDVMQVLELPAHISNQMLLRWEHQRLLVRGMTRWMISKTADISD